MLWGWCNWRGIDNAVGPRQMVDRGHCFDWRADFGVGSCNDQRLTPIEHTCSRNARWRCCVGNFHFPDQRSSAEPRTGLGTSTSACNLHPGLSGELALGSAAWGAVAQRAGIRIALVWAGVGTIGSVMLRLAGPRDRAQ